MPDITLAKAIEILELNIRSVGNQMPSDTLLAVKLMVEAGKRIQRQRLNRIPINQPLLPGEEMP